MFRQTIQRLSLSDRLGRINTTFNKTTLKTINTTFKRSYTLKQLTNVGQLSQLKNPNSVYYEIFINQFTYRIRMLDSSIKSPLIEIRLNENKKILDQYVKFHTLFFNLPQEFKQNNLNIIKELNEYVNSKKKEIEIIEKTVNEMNTCKQVNHDLDYLMEEDHEF